MEIYLFILFFGKGIYSNKEKGITTYTVRIEKIYSWSFHEPVYEKGQIYKKKF